MSRARFDDSSAGRTQAWELTGPIGALVAWDVDAVVDVLAAAERRALDGYWVAGFVSYDAAPALVPEAPVPERAVREAGEVREPRPVPLAWFGVFTGRREVDPLPVDVDGCAPAPATCRVTEHEHAAAVAEIREAIGRGDVYQVNLTARLDQPVGADPEQVYARLVDASAAQYCAHLSFEGVDVLSISPELFFEIDDHTIRTRPMKGTARRGRWSEEDLAMATALEASEKDRAENVMIVDLLRNDLGRVAVVGSVQVEELLSLERYPTVWQLTSTVSATLPSAWSLVDVFRALFPCGSVTGAPKIAAMRAITALETSPRGVYCGTVGWIAPGRKHASFNVAIRTAVLDGSGLLTYGSGGGVTWGSSSAAEWDELQAKAEVLTRVPSTAVGLVETMRWEPGSGIELLALHLARLQASGTRLGVPVDPVVVQNAIDGAVAGRDTGARVRLVVHPDGTLTVTSADLAPCSPDPVRLALDGDPIDPADLCWYHKTTDRERYDGRRRDAPHADDVVLLNRHGEVTETTIASIGARIDGQWCTPPLGSGCLPGVYRRHLLDRGVLVERAMTVDDLRDATELAVFNAVRGWRAAVLV
ncbi:MAG: aminodeoxychorismate synthase component I [Acidimicrobiia bacterium]